MRYMDALYFLFVRYLLDVVKSSNSLAPNIVNKHNL